MEQACYRLTVISAIFLPLTLVTGFLGMILLGQPFGSELIVLVMVAILLSMLVYFHREGWFE